MRNAVGPAEAVLGAYGCSLESTQAGPMGEASVCCSRELSRVVDSVNWLDVP